MRPIDADALIKAFEKAIDDESQLFNEVANKIIRILKLAPSLEVVPKDFHDKTCEAMAKRHREEVERLMPKRGWIPCSERLPNDGDRIAVQYANGDLGAINSCRMRLWNIINSPYATVVAWMLLPEPWKGADDE